MTIDEMAEDLEYLANKFENKAALHGQVDEGVVKLRLTADKLRSMEARIQELEAENETVETVSDEQTSWTEHFRTMFNQAMDENDKLKARLKAADELVDHIDKVTKYTPTSIIMKACAYRNAGKE